tara:strand:- start:21750 stop:21872 length:123 start_codon:yes stop_codon:yes gene_type:complete
MKLNQNITQCPELICRQDSGKTVLLGERTGLDLVTPEQQI